MAHSTIECDCGYSETDVTTSILVDERVDPTCTEAGSVTYKAVFVKLFHNAATIADAIPATGHTEVIDSAVEPTCTEPGKTEGKHCSVCGEVLVAQEEIPAKGHIEGSPVKENETAAGYDEVVYCTACGEELSRKSVAVTATLTFDLAGGTLDGKTGTITVTANVGDTIELPGAPSRDGYTFKYWKGSEYEAGAEYTVEGDHEFTAEWEKDTEPAPSEPDTKPEPTTPATGGDATKPAIPVTGEATALVLPLPIAALGSLCVFASNVMRRRKDN